MSRVFVLDSQRPHTSNAGACQTQVRRCPAPVPDRDGLESRGLRWNGHGTSRCFLSLEPCRSRVKSSFGVSGGAQSRTSRSNMREGSVPGTPTRDRHTAP